jgi:hypothetical protein
MYLTLFPETPSPTSHSECKREDTGFQGSVSSGGEKMRRCACSSIYPNYLSVSLPDVKSFVSSLLTQKASAVIARKLHTKWYAFQLEKFAIDEFRDEKVGVLHVNAAMNDV